MKDKHGNEAWHALSDEQPRWKADSDEVVKEKLAVALADVATLRRQMGEMERYWRAQVARLTAEKRVLQASLSTMGRR